MWLGRMWYSDFVEKRCGLKSSNSRQRLMDMAALEEYIALNYGCSTWREKDEI